MGRKGKYYHCIRQKRYTSHLKKANMARKKGVSGPKSLVVLCERVIKKYKLLPEKKKFTAPETFSVIGGKPLRKRSEKPPKDEVIKEKKEKKGKNPQTLAALCQFVIREYNLLPQCEETEQPLSNQLLLKQITPSRKRGRPPKPEKEKKVKQSKKPRGRQPKDPMVSIEFGEASTSQSTFLEQSQKIRTIKVEQDCLDDPLDQDPLREDEEDFTVVIKEENIDVDPEEFTRQITVEVPQASAQGIVINPLAQVEIPGPCVKVVPMTATVFMDEYQIFANSVAEQLRSLPPNRALLLQFDIQSMIDNEKQLMGHES